MRSSFPTSSSTHRLARAASLSSEESPYFTPSSPEPRHGSKQSHTLISVTSSVRIYILLVTLVIFTLLSLTILGLLDYRSQALFDKPLHFPNYIAPFKSRNWKLDGVCNPNENLRTIKSNGSPSDSNSPIADAWAHMKYVYRMCPAWSHNTTQLPFGAYWITDPQEQASKWVRTRIARVENGTWIARRYTSEFPYFNHKELLDMHLQNNIAKQSNLSFSSIQQGLGFHYENQLDLIGASWWESTLDNTVDQSMVHFFNRKYPPMRESVLIEEIQPQFDRSAMSQPQSTDFEEMSSVLVNASSVSFKMIPRTFQTKRLLVWEVELLQDGDADPQASHDLVNILASINPHRNTPEKEVEGSAAFMETNQKQFDKLVSETYCFYHYEVNADSLTTSEELSRIALELSVAQPAASYVHAYGENNTQTYASFIRCPLPNNTISLLTAQEIDPSLQLHAVTLFNPSLGLSMTIPMCRARVRQIGLSLCTSALFGPPHPLTPKMLGDFLNYYLYLGFNQIYAFDRYSTLYPALLPYVKRGLVQYTVVPRVLRVRRYDQVYLNQVCLMQNRQTSSYVLYADTDEFLVNYHPYMTTPEAFSQPHPGCYNASLSFSLPTKAGEICPSYMRRWLSDENFSADWGAILFSSVVYLDLPANEQPYRLVGHTAPTHIVSRWHMRLRGRDERDKSLIKPKGSYMLWIHNTQHRLPVISSHHFWGDDMGLTFRPHHVIPINGTYQIEDLSCTNNGVPLSNFSYFDQPDSSYSVDCLSTAAINDSSNPRIWVGTPFHTSEDATSPKFQLSDQSSALPQISTLLTPKTHARVRHTYRFPLSIYNESAFVFAGRIQHYANVYTGRTVDLINRIQTRTPVVDKYDASELIHEDENVYYHLMPQLLKWVEERDWTNEWKTYYENVWKKIEIEEDIIRRSHLHRLKTS